jgi:hypothetical protein
VARFKRVAAILALAVLLAALPGTAYAKKTIGLSSGSFEFSVNPGETGQGEVTVMNDGDEPLKALVYVADMQIDSAGEVIYVTPQREGAALLTTPATWFRIYMPADSKSVGNTPYVELDPGERLPIQFEFSPPAGTAPGDHNAVIFFEMFELTSGAEGSSAQVTGRLGTRIALRVNGQLVEKLSVRPFEVPMIQLGRKVPYKFTLNNEGNVNERVMVTASVLDSDEREISSSEVSTDTILFAGSGRQFAGEVTLPSQRIGPHTVEVRTTFLKVGDQVETEVVERRTVWLLPLWLVVFAGFVVVYGIGYLVLRALKKRRARREAAKAARHRASRRQRDLEAEQRRMRREQRAAEAAAGLDEDPDAVQGQSG